MICGPIAFCSRLLLWLKKGRDARPREVAPAGGNEGPVLAPWRLARLLRCNPLRTQGAFQMSLVLRSALGAVRGPCLPACSRPIATGAAELPIAAFLLHRRPVPTAACGDPFWPTAHLRPRSAADPCRCPAVSALP